MNTKSKTRSIRFPESRVWILEEIDKLAELEGTTANMYMLHALESSVTEALHCAIRCPECNEIVYDERRMTITEASFQCPNCGHAWNWLE